ncbi:uncharacterized protein LOC124257623 [Haliotis rubra]|uniref:uncharacterized protein LOC124257623 n=1 Tax=Haliotis rubra TaxID=36100 RepID=UPI001EE5C1CF|nr:uncharacterized protein LOC124257623 [Haliotis rubra]
MEDKTEQTFPFMDPTRISFLKRVSIEGQLKDIHPEVRVCIDGNQIQVVGSRKSVSDTGTLINNILEETDLYEMTVKDPSRVRLLQTDVTRRYIGGKMLQKGLQAVYETCNDKINVRCKRGEFDRVRVVIDSAIVSEEVDASENGVDASEIGVTLRRRLENFRDCTEVDDNQMCTRISVHADKYQPVMQIVDAVKQSRKERTADSGFGDGGECQDNGGVSQEKPNGHGDESVLYSERCKLQIPGIENIMRSDRFQELLDEAAQGQNASVASCHVSEEQGKISIKEGRLEDIGFKVDVIVCAAARNLDLSTGVVVKALSEAAGPELQKRCEDKFKVEEMKTTSVTVVPPYHLNCNNVLFVCLPHWDKRQETDRKEKYQSILKECLERISRIEPVPSSIAVPALGCGNIGFPRELVVDLMMDTLKQYIRTHQVDVHVILPPHSQDISQIFQTRREAFHIGDIRLTVRRGDILEEQTDAIVNSISEDQSLTGTLSTKLVERFGEKFEADFAKHSSTLQRSGLSFCKACKPWTCIVHLFAKEEERNGLGGSIAVMLERNLGKIQTSVFSFPLFWCGFRYIS